LFRPPTGATTGAVVLFLHGTGGTASWAADETGWPDLAARENFLLVLPEGLPPNPRKPPKFLTNPPRWNDGSSLVNSPWSLVSGPSSVGFNPLPEDQGRLTTDQTDDVGFLAAVIEDVLRRESADPRRVYLSGFSNGAGMAFRFAAERADLLAAIAPVAGYCAVGYPQPSRPVPTLYLVGTADPLVPLHGGSVRLPWGGPPRPRPPVMQTLAKWAGAIGCDPVPIVESDAGGVRRERFPGHVEYQAIFVDGLGHHWPGGAGRLDPHLGGAPSDRLNANETIWTFFQRQVA
jgi:polyhydroxybutyrate depolymerase